MQQRSDGLTVVTGAATGIGRAVVDDVLAAAGSCCMAVDLDQDRLRELETGSSGRVTTVAADLATEHGIAAVVDAVKNAGRPITGLVNAAGNHHTGRSIDVEISELRRVMGVHFEAALRISQAVAVEMEHNGGGSIVNFSSVAARFAWPKRLPYAASKAAVEAMTRTLASEWSPMGIRVNAVAPGYVGTDMVRALASAGAFDAEQRVRSHVLGRFAQPTEIARMVTFLLGDGSSFITGEVITVDGGFSITKDAHDATTTDHG